MRNLLARLLFQEKNDLIAGSSPGVRRVVDTPMARGLLTEASCDEDSLRQRVANMSISVK